jgi:hypothetical protein
VVEHQTGAVIDHQLGWKTVSNRTALQLVPASTDGASQPSEPHRYDEAVEAFLAGYSGETHRAYRYHLQMYRRWCDARGMHPFDARRPDLRAYLAWLQEPARKAPGGWSQSTVQIRINAVRVFYRESVVDEYLLIDPRLYSGQLGRRARGRTIRTTATDSSPRGQVGPDG